MITIFFASLKGSTHSPLLGYCNRNNSIRYRHNPIDNYEEKDVTQLTERLVVKNSIDVKMSQKYLSLNLPIQMKL